MKRISILALCVALPVLRAQHDEHMHHGEANDAGAYLMTLASGTGANPQSAPMPMLMPKLGSWSLMIMGQAFIVETQQTGPRGGDKFYSPNWGMFSAEHRFLGGSFMFQSMLSLDPAMVSNRSYPLLFQTGESAFGKPLTDAQHPHSFVMGLGIHYARPLGEKAMLHFYYAPVGDPALGPVAFPHRSSAAELPQATLSHHWQDATHIADNVATVAMKYKWLRLEASSFYGTEPSEHRWKFDWGPMNSYSGRLSIAPSSRWLAQVSAGRITRPERLAPGDVIRSTASIHYSRPLDSGNAWSTSLIWGRNHDTFSQHNLNSYLLETLYPVTGKNLFTARAELVDKDELFANNQDVEAHLEHTAGSTFRIKSFTAGYTRELTTLGNVGVAAGANVSSYAIPSAIKPYYGDYPVGVNVFLRFRLRSGS